MATVKLKEKRKFNFLVLALLLVAAAVTAYYFLPI